jgi:hypothetical protein
VSPLELVAAQFDAYNAQDLERMLATYSEDCIVAELNGPVLQSGKAEIRARYAKTFKDYPHNRARSVNRIVLGATVIDHEQVSRGPGGPHFEAICVYTIKDGQVARVDFAQ